MGACLSPGWAWWLPRPPPPGWVGVCLRKASSRTLAAQLRSAGSRLRQVSWAPGLCLVWSRRSVSGGGIMVTRTQLSREETLETGWCHRYVDGERDSFCAGIVFTLVLCVIGGLGWCSVSRYFYVTFFAKSCCTSLSSRNLGLDMPPPPKTRLKLL